MHRQRQGPSPLRVRRQGVARHHAPSLQGRPVHRPRQGAARQPLRRPHARHRDPGDRDADRRNLARIVADRGYRGHNAPPDHKFKVYISGQRRRVTEAIKRQLRRRSAVEPVIGHAKTEHRMGRNYLAGAMATPPTPSSPPPVTTSACSSPGSPPFGVSSSWRSSPAPGTLPSQRQNAPEAHRSPTPRQTSRSSQSTKRDPKKRRYLFRVGDAASTLFLMSTITPNSADFVFPSETQSFGRQSTAQQLANRRSPAGHVTT